MKRVIFLLMVCLSVLGVSAQNYSNIKTMLVLNKYQEAKADFDKAMSNSKFASKPEAFVLKTAIYAGLAMSETNKNTPAGDQLAMEALAAFKKYLEMEPELSLVKDPVYQNGPINLYSNFYSGGYDEYTKNKWQSGFEKLKLAVEMSDFLISQKWISAPLDTNVLILAGITAEKSGNKKDATIYYGKLADNKVAGEGFESIYRFLVSHYFEVKNMEAFEKYKSLGKELFPQSEYFTYDKVDFAVGLAEGFTAKSKALEEVLAADPNNYKANQIMGEIIYDTLNSEVEGAVLPANADELEKKMVASFLKAAAAKPNFEISYLYIGDHFINKAAKVNDERAAHTADMKARTKPGTMSSKEDIAKRDMLDIKYGEVLDKAKEPYEKAIEILGSRAKAENGLELRDKEQYKKAINYFSEIFAYKRIMAKGKPADQAKYAAEEKKWNDLYDTVNSIPTLKRDR